MCTSWLHHKCTHFAEDIIDKITNLFYFTRRTWMFTLRYIRVSEKILLLFLGTYVFACYQLVCEVWLYYCLSGTWIETSSLNERMLWWKGMSHSGKWLMLFVFHFPFQTRLRTSFCLASTLLYLCFCRRLIPSFSFMFSKDLSFYFIASVHSAFL